MEIAALTLYGVFIVLGFGWRSYRQWRRTGSTGMRGIHGRSGSLEWLAGVGFVAAMAIGVLAPVLQLTGVVAPLAVLDHRAVGLMGWAAAILGIAATLWAQESMGDSWRIGVDRGETTQLVERGVFAIVRNPIFTAMLVFGGGVTLMAPNALALAGFGLLLLAIEMHVRTVEEPYLRATHGQRYGDYVARVGRFIPGVGRVSAQA
ncbi:MAG TPA: isoprenylcysteine carboxylmethyltransferase family protein [Mycobacterium sp.]|nr:isoprenylcysteine carboxylmethyltransferase family protein [Mycobacterium sp.]